MRWNWEFCGAAFGGLGVWALELELLMSAMVRGFLTTSGEVEGWGELARRLRLRALSLLCFLGFFSRGSGAVGDIVFVVGLLVGGLVFTGFGVGGTKKLTWPVRRILASRAANVPRIRG